MARRPPTIERPEQVADQLERRIARCGAEYVLAADADRPLPELDPAQTYRLCDGWGSYRWTPAGLRSLDAAGFRVYDTIVYHPDHWVPVAPGGPGAVPRDGSVVRTDEAAVRRK